MWGRMTLPSGPSASCHVHVLHVSMFGTILAYFCHISCIQIILQAQVELGKIKTKFYTCDDDLLDFAMLLGGILMVKMSVSDRQQPPRNETDSLDFYHRRVNDRCGSGIGVAFAPSHENSGRLGYAFWLPALK